MKNIENLQYSGTKLNADAIMTNAESGITELTVENTSGEDGKALEIVAGANTQIDLSSLVQKAGATNKAALDITGFKTSTGSTQAQSVKLTNTTAESSFAETVKLGDATGITVTNIGTGDKLSAKTFGAEVVGAFDGNITTITGNKAYYTSAESANLDKTVSDTLAKFTTSGDAILAVNVENKAHIYALTGSANESERKFTLVAIVDNNIDGEDTVEKAVAGTNPTDTTIIFKAPVAPTTLTYVSGATSLELADGSYDTQTFTTPVIDPANISITGVDGVLKITDFGGNSTGKVTVATLNDADLSGSEYDNVEVSIGGNNITAKTVGGAKKYAATLATDKVVTIDDITNLSTLSLKDVDAKIKVAAEVNNGVNLGDTFTNASSNDKIALTLASSVTTVTLTNAAETIDASKVTPITENQYKIAEKFVNIADNDTINGLKFGTQTSGNALDLTLSAAKETIDISAAKGKSGALTITANGFAAADKFKVAESSAKATVLETKTLKNALEVDKITKVAITNGVLQLSKDAAVADAKLASAISAINAKYTEGSDKDVAAAKSWVLFTTTDSTDAGTYLIYNGANNTATTDDVVIKLTGTISDFAIAENLLSVTFNA